MVGDSEGVNAAPFDGFDCRLDVFIFILPDNFGLVVMEGGYPQ